MFGNFGASSTFGAFSGSNPQTNVFGQPAQQQPASLFGGGFNQPKATFGSSFGSPATTSTMFGNNRLNNPTTTMFGGGQTATVSPFSTTNTNQNQAGTSIPFNAITGTDTMMRNGVASPINTRHQCITCMKEYENKSLEELRLEDYQLNRKGPPQSAIFGGSNTQQSTSIFSSINANTGTPNTFGQQTNTFGSPSTGSGLFSNLPTKPTSSFFSTNQTSTAPFGGGTPAFSFSNTSSQPASIFTSTNSTAGALGTSSFTFQQPQQSALSGGLFGKSMTPATSSTTSTFGGFGTGTTMAKPGGIFSSTPAATTFGGGTSTQFGTGSGGMFGAQQQQQQQKPFSFGTPFTSQPATASGFGGATAPTFNFNSSTPAPTLGFGTTPSFGAPGTSSTGFGNFGAAPNFSVGNPTTSAGFGAPSFSFTTPSTGMGFSAYNQSNAFTQPSQQFSAPNVVPFATTPYKDSPLFYNLITNRSLEEMTKPTNPMAQRAIKEASRRRHSTSFNTTGSSSVKSFTFPVKKTQPFSKQAAIFDGFEDDSTSLIDILSPKSSVKKLSLKSIKAFEKTRYSLPTFSRTSQPLTSSPNVDSSLDMNNTSGNSSFDDSIHIGRTNGEFGLSKSGESTNESFQSVGDNGDLNEGQENGDAPIHSSGGSKIFGSRGCGLICTRPGYYVRPNIDELNFKTDELNNCLVKGFVVGRHNFGEIRFLEVVNVAGINIDEIVLFRHKEVVVYPDDDCKPPIGEGLNCAAEVCIERVWPIEKTTKDPIKSSAMIRAMNYENKLRRACVRLDAEFMSYNEETGTWTFRVKHFSKYNCEVEENEDDEDIPPMKKLKGKGLGGIPSQQLGLGQPKPQSQGPESSSTSTLSSMLMHKAWGGGDSSFSIETDMPVFHTLMSSTVAGKPHISEQERDDYDYVAEGEIEHNPLTPSESEESDKEALKYDSRASTYESILNVSPRSPRVAHLKSMFSLFPEDEDTSLGPDFKIADPSTRSKRTNELFKPSLSVDARQYFLDKENVDYENMFSSPIFYRGDPRRGAKSSSPIEERSHIWFVSFQDSVNSSGPILPPYKSRNEIILLPDAPAKSMFNQMEEDFIPGLKRGCGRVSFLRNGQLLCVINNKVNWKGSDAVSGRVTIYGRECYDSLIPRSISRLYIETINKQMNIELSVRKEESQNPFPSHAEEEKDCLVVIPRHVDVLSGASRANIELDNVNSLHFGKLLHEYQVWNLCDILWCASEDDPRDPGSFFKQRERLSTWFKNNRSYLFGWMEAPTESTSPLELLKYGMDTEACELAVLQGNYNLALLLSQRCDLPPEFCLDQIEAWAESGSLEFIPEDTLEIFRIFSGTRLPSRYGVAPMTNREWLQNFAIHLWYSCPPTWSLKQVISSYLDVIHTQVDWSPETEDFREENQPSNTNMFISLLKLYGSCDYPLKFILDSRRNNLGSLEYKLPFLLMNNLRHKGYIADPTLFENVCLGFAGQLNTMGLYDWAIFVLQYLPYETSKIVIDKALQNYIKCEDQRRAEHFLVENLDISLPQIFSLKAQHASFIERPDHELWYSLKFGDYQEAYKIFAKKLFTICINCKQNESKVLQILEELYQYETDIPEWSLHGQLVRSYLTLQKIRDSDATLAIDTKHVEKNIKNFLTSFVQYKPLNNSESAFLLELALSAQKMVALLVIDNKLRQIEDGEEDLEENNLINLMKLPVPNEYMSTVQKFVATWMAV